MSRPPQYEPSILPGSREPQVRGMKLTAIIKDLHASVAPSESWAWVAAIMVTVLLTGCATIAQQSAKWEESKVEGPWIAPKVQAREMHRTYYAHLMDAGATSDTVWVDGNGRRHNVEGVMRSIDSFLKKNGFFERWPESQASVRDYRMKYAPFKFYVVSVTPIVVVMSPHELGNTKGRSAQDVVGPWGKAAWPSLHMLNCYEYGPQVPYKEGLLWFSPDLNVLPTPLTGQKDSSLELAHKRIQMTATKTGSYWRFARD